jgi:hypothetical protein
VNDPKIGEKWFLKSRRGETTPCLILTDNLEDLTGRLLVMSRNSYRPEVVDRRDLVAKMPDDMPINWLFVKDTAGLVAGILAIVAAIFLPICWTIARTFE